MVRRRFGWLPPACRRAGAGLVASVPNPIWRGLSPPGAAPRLADRARRLAALLRAGDADGLYRRQHSQWDDPAALVPGGVEPAVGAFAADGRPEIPNFIERMQLFDSLTYLHDDILTKVDRASMAVNLEVRVPLLDHRLVEFAWRLPFDMRLGQDGGKRLLRDVLHRHVPQALVSRPKMGFGVPIGRWLRGPVRDWAEALLDEHRLRREALFDPAPIRRMWDDIVTGRTEIQEPIWGILMFQAWHEMYAGGGRSAGASAPDAPRRRLM